MEVEAWEPFVSGRVRARKSSQWAVVSWEEKRPFSASPVSGPEVIA